MHVFVFIINIHIHTYYVNNFYFGMRLITINHLTALIYIYIYIYIYDPGSQNQS